jgi:hypothetical protein
VLIALLPRVRSCKRRCDLESFDECVWSEIPTYDGLNLLIGIRYFPPDTKPEIITNYVRFLENNLDTQNFRVILMGDFNTSRFDWKRGLSQANCHYYSKLKGEAIYTSTCLLDLRQRIDAVGSSCLLDIAFTNFRQLNINFIDSCIIKPTQPPIQWVPGVLSPGVKPGRGVMLTTHPHLVPRLSMSRSYTSSHPMRLHGV